MDITGNNLRFNNIKRRNVSILKVITCLAVSFFFRIMLLAVDLLTQWKTDDFFNRKKMKTFFCKLENNYQTHNHKIHNGDAEILFINF